MPKLVPISAKKMIKILAALGFIEIRSRGSHHFFLNPKTKNTTVIPIHGNDNLGTGLLKEILKDIDISVDEFDRLRIKK